MRAALSLCLVLGACTQPLKGPLDAGIAPPTPGNATACLLLPELIDFGDLLPGMTVRTFTLTNSSPGDVRFHVGPVTGAFVVSIDREVLAPRTSTILSVQVTATDARLQLGEFRFIGGEGCPEKTIALRAQGLGHALIEPSVLEFPAIDAGTSLTLPVRVANATRADASLRVLVVPDTVPNGSFTLASPPPPVAVGEVAEFGVTFRATGNGPANATLVITTTNDLNTLTEFIPIVAMAGVPKLRLFPTEELHLVRTPSGSQQQWTFRFDNTGAGEPRAEFAEVVADAGDPES